MRVQLRSSTGNEAELAAVPRLFPVDRNEKPFQDRVLIARATIIMNTKIIKTV
jgi:hypothetical protein